MANLLAMPKKHIQGGLARAEGYPGPHSTVRAASAVACSSVEAMAAPCMPMGTTVPTFSQRSSTSLFKLIQAAATQGGKLPPWGDGTEGRAGYAPPSPWVLEEPWSRSSLPWRPFCWPCI